MWRAGFCPSEVAVERLSSCISWALEHRLNSSGAQATSVVVLQHVVLRNRSGPGVEPVFPVLADRFFFFLVLFILLVGG